MEVPISWPVDHTYLFIHLVLVASESISYDATAFFFFGGTINLYGILSECWQSLRLDHIWPASGAPG